MNKPNPARASRGPELTQVRWIKGRGIRLGKEEDHPGPPCVGSLTVAGRLPDVCGLNALGYGNDEPYWDPICRYPFDVNLRGGLPTLNPLRIFSRNSFVSG